MDGGQVKVTDISSLKKGSYIVIEGAASVVVDTQTSRPGKHGHAKVRLTAVGIIDNKKREIVKSGHDNVEVPIIEKKTAQVLSITGDMANVMDAENYETFDMKIPEDLKEEIRDGCNILYWTILTDRVMKQVKPE